MKNRFIIMLTVLSLILPGALISPASAAEYAQADPADFAGKKIGVAVGSVQEKWAEEEFTQSEIVYFSTYPDGILAVETGTVDAMYFSDLSLRYAAGAKKDLEILLMGSGEVPVAPVFPKSEKGDRLRGEFNEYLAEIRENGTLERITKKWADGSEELRAFDDPSEPPEVNGKLNIITQSAVAPYDYLKNGSICGLEAEVVREFCRKFGYKPVFHNANFDAAVMGVYTEKYDMGAAALMITEERAKSVSFADPMCTCRGALLVKKGAAAGAADAEKPYTRSALPMGDITEFYGKRIGVQSGTAEEAKAGGLFRTTQLSYYSGFADSIVALHTGKVDAICADDVAIRYAAGNIEDLIVLDIGQEEIHSAPIFPKTEHGDLLRSQYNEFLKKFKDSGRLEEITKKWIDGPEEIRTMDTAELPDTNGILTIGTEIGYAPQEYIKDGEVVGLEAELLTEFCREYGYRPEFQNAALDSLVMGVYTGKFDIGASALTITEERAKTVNFGDPFLTCYPSVLVRRDGGWTGTDSAGEDADRAGSSELIEGFKRTFVEEDRWKMFAGGVEVTFLITLLSVLIGTAAGFGLYLLCRNGNRAANAIVNAVNWFITGMPLVVFLMVLFYIVFSKAALSGTAVAIIGFSVVFALTVFYLLKLGEGAVDPGQKEAAYALGYSDIDAFMRIILPQAAKHFLPSYRGEVVSLIKATAVVGYITVMDITKIGDVIRGRTYDAVFPLLAVVAAYFLLSAVFKAAINLLIKKADTKARPQSKIMKGVEIR